MTAVPQTPDTSNAKQKSQIIEFPEDEARGIKTIGVYEHTFNIRTQDRPFSLKIREFIDLKDNRVKYETFFDEVYTKEDCLKIIQILNRLAVSNLTFRMTIPSQLTRGRTTQKNIVFSVTGNSLEFKNAEELGVSSFTSRYSNNNYNRGPFENEVKRSEVKRFNDHGELEQ